MADPRYATQRVFSLDVEGQRYWVKRASKDYKNLLQAWLFPNRTQLRDEAQAMRALQQRGMRVPAVVHESSDFIVLSDVGESMQRHIHLAQGKQRSHYVAQVAETLSQLHRAGGWHGNAALRNFTWHDGQIGMIDFENTAHRLWSRNIKHAFDIWQALYSCARFEDGSQLARVFLAHYRPSSRGLVYLRAMAWLASPLYITMAPFSLRLKRDIRQAVTAIGTLLRRSPHNALDF